MCAKRWWTFALSIALSLIVLELGLRAASWVLVRVRAASLERSADPDALRVLHLGESTTFGLGVDAAAAYPAVTESLLESRMPGVKITTFNGGLPGATSAALVRKLTREIAMTHPQLVVILAGANDFNERLNPYLMEGLIGAGWRLPHWIIELRTWKLGMLLLSLVRPEVHWVEGARQTGVKFVSCFVEPADPTLFLSDGWHPSAAGHRYIAKRLAAVLKAFIQRMRPELI